MTFEQNPEGEEASPMEPGRGNCKNRSSACQDARAASPHPTERKALTPQANLWFLLSATCKAIEGSRSDLVPQVI